jgi:hypothetical protein
MPNQSSTYSPARIAALRKLVAKAPDISGALDLLEKELKVHRDSCRRISRRYGLYHNALPVAALKKAHREYSAKVILTKLPAVAPEGRPLRRLFLDIETSPNIVLSWRIGYKINIDYSNLLKERAIICVAYKWEDDDEVHSLTWDKDQNDRTMLAELVEVISEADEIVGHNLDAFDLPWIKTRLLFHKLPALPDVKVVDTLTIAKKSFYFNSNKLDYLGTYLGFGGKLETGFGLWKAVVLDKNPEALADMVTYCKRDITLLEKVYHRLAATVAAKTHVGVLGGLSKWTNPHTGSTNVVLSKTRVSAAGTVSYQMQCKDSGCYYTINAKAYQDYLAAKS